jgi:putative methylase
VSKRALERRLADLAGFDQPRADLEQYATPADLAAHLVHRASLEGDLAGRTVVDLGTGTGILALGAAARGPRRVVGIDVDRSALGVARDNGRRFEPSSSVHWLRADATRPPLTVDGPATIVANPPFGAQDGNEGADRAFLAAASELAAVSYTVHNAGSRGFVESFVDDAGGEVTHAFEASFAVDRQFEFHTEARRELTVEVYRVEWG